MKQLTLKEKIGRAKHSITRGRKEMFAGELSEQSMRDRINHFLWLKDHLKK